jgi:hypothetical protein
MGSGSSCALACCEAGGACDCCSTPLRRANLDGAAQELATRTGATNLLLVHVGSDESERLGDHLQSNRRCAIEVTVKVLSGRITAVALNVNVNPHGNRKLVPLPVQPETDAPPAAWSNSFAPGFSQQQQQQAAHQHHEGLGHGGVRFRLTPQHTNNFEPGPYPDIASVTCAVVPWLTRGSIHLFCVVLVLQEIIT